MPTLELKTNVQIKDPDFGKKFSKFGAEVLSKPERYICTSSVHVPTMTFSGSTDPCYILSIGSLDNLSPEKNDVYSKRFAEYFKEHLGAANDRGYVIFLDPGRAYIGHEGTTFETIFGKN